MANTPIVFNTVNVDTTAQVIANMASLSKDELQRLANFYAASAMDFSNKLSSTRTSLITALALTVIAAVACAVAKYKAVTSNDWKHRDYWDGTCFFFGILLVWRSFASFSLLLDYGKMSSELANANMWNHYAISMINASA